MYMYMYTQLRVFVYKCISPRQGWIEGGGVQFEYCIYLLGKTLKI